MANAEKTVETNNGASIPLIGLGTWQMSDSEAYESVLLALEKGYRHIDTAKMYGNEPGVGRAVRDSGIPREDIFITTKLPPNDAGFESRTLDESLTKLGLDYIDLWLIHAPPKGLASVPTWEAFLLFQAKGHARSVGVSNYTIAQLDELIAATSQPPAVNQIKWGPSLFDLGILTDHQDRGIVLEGYSPFKTTDLNAPVLKEIAQAHNVSTAQVVLRWHVERNIVAIPKSSTPERIAANLDVFDFQLSVAEVELIDNLS